MILEQLFAHARSAPADVTITDDSGSHTYAELAASAVGLSMFLRQQTQSPHVGLFLPSGFAFAASFYGTLLAGKSVVPINFLLGDREIAHVIADSGIDTILTVGPLAGRLAAAPVRVIDLMQLPRPSAGALPALPPIPQCSADDLAVLMYTSGTSALPKGVMLTFGNLLSDLEACIAAAQLQTRHVFLGMIPLFHAFGMTAMMLAPVHLGSPIVYHARFSAVAAVESIRRHKVSIMFGVPSMFGAMLHLKSASADDFKSIYALISGGEPLPSTLRENFPQRFGVPIYEGYGLTETSPVVSLNTPQAARVHSVGRPIPGVEVRIVDDEGQLLPANQSGEVWLRGPMVMKGYYNLPAETAAALTPDRFLKTGDLGKLDDDGFLYITGRKKDLIIVAGEKVVPREVEEILTRHPAVAEAAVVGRKDPSRGEAVVAFIVLHKDAAATAEQLRVFCRDQGLPAFKTPRDVVFVAELPRSPTGKVLKRVLADRVVASS